jgi:3-deoxy-7-phosphoheptulonate synthase
MMSNNWTKNSWRNFPVLQQPDWMDLELHRAILDELASLPSLVFSGETRSLRQELAAVNRGEKFVLQIGNCSESFSDCNGPKIHNFIRIMMQMVMAIEHHSEKKIVKIGRIAGQYAKPRSEKIERINNEDIPTYRGDIVNGYAQTLKSRQPDSTRLLDGYFRSAATLNLLRAFTQGGYGEIKNLLDWKNHFFYKEILDLEYYKNLETELSKSFAQKDDRHNSTFNNEIIYTSHEALLLDYEEVFTRIDTTTGGYYSTSAHSLWIGDRTRQLDGAHVEFMRGIGNPIGLKVGPNHDIDQIIAIVEKLNPANEEGKIMLINRLGNKRVGQLLGPLIKKVKKKNLEVIWCCDPMHGNTFNHSGYKVRAFDDIISETKTFIDICKNEGVVPGGIHLEITGDYVSECIGGVNGLSLGDVGNKYTTKVDPRLNAAQAIEAAFIIGKSL